MLLVFILVIEDGKESANSFPDKINSIIINNAIIGSATVVKYGQLPHGAPYTPTMALFVYQRMKSYTDWAMAGFYTPTKRGYFYVSFGDAKFSESYSGVTVNSQYILCDAFLDEETYYYAVK